MSRFQPAVEAGWYSNFGPVSIALERDVEANLLADGMAVACSNCTAGLTAALFALGVDGQVLIPGFTFQATASAVIGASLDVVVGDVDPGTGVLSADSVGRAISEGCRAVILVRPYGIWSDVSDVAEICRQAKVPLIIDNAAGLGVGKDIDARYGVPDAIEVYSLHATKPFGVGEGGLMRVPAWLEREVRAALNFGMSSVSGRGRGLNGKMPELTAAVALAARAHLAQRVAERQAMAAVYTAAADEAGFHHFASDVAASPWQCFPVLTPSGASPEAIVERGLRAGLQLRRYYQPLLGFPGMLAASALSGDVICLPVYDGRDAGSAEEIWDIFRSAI